MQNDSKNETYSFITVVLVCFFLSAFVFPISVYAAGEIAAWGYNGYGECNVPSPNTGFTAISAGGGYFSLGLKPDGSVVAWGENNSGQCNVPSPNTGFTAIAAGSAHALGLKPDGSIVAWGDNTWGECDVPSPNTNFIAVAAGNYHSLGLKADGSIVVLGSNDYEQSKVPLPNTGFMAIAAGNTSLVGLKTDGSVVAWGYTWSGENDVPSPNTGFVAIAACGYHVLGLKSDGSIVAWGNNYYGQCTVPLPNTGFVAIAAGWDHSLGLKADGSIVAWGGNLDYWGHYSGQCNVPSPNTGFTAIAAGWSHSLGLQQVSKPAKLQGIEIVGPNSVPEESDTQYKVIGHYDNGSSKNITTDANLAVAPDEFAQIDSNGLLATDRLYRMQETCTISADCQSFSASKPVTIYPVCDGNQCTEQQLLKRDITDVIKIKQDVMDDLKYAMKIERVSSQLLTQIDGDKKYKDFNHGQLTKARIQILAALMWEQWANNKIDTSIDSLEDALKILQENLVEKPKSHK
jgi:hypothetical protein